MNLSWLEFILIVLLLTYLAVAAAVGHGVYTRCPVDRPSHVPRFFLFLCYAYMGLIWPRFAYLAIKEQYRKKS